MDLSISFDCMHHDLLIAKLHAYRISTNSLKLLKSYLTNRQQRVKIGIADDSTILSEQPTKQQVVEVWRAGSNFAINGSPAI